MDEDDAEARGGCFRLWGLAVDGAIDEDDKPYVSDAIPTEGSRSSVGFDSIPKVGAETGTGKG